MELQDWVLVFIIAILYSYFFKKLADVVTGTHEINNMCERFGGTGIFNIYSPNSEKDPEWVKCRNEQKQRREQADTTKFMILLVAGVAGAIVASQIKLPVGNIGIGFGSILTVLYATYVYWSHFNEIMKLGATGASLAALIYATTKLKYF